ncbi:hypothetical protein [Aromatoleum toluclasticum]|uniref:hypothetical protein n=1 Tax=Aromatoleum toluclasticum TaxID=92003 RepID=UPI0012FB5433|nr:hypothetical protein [Aromatoleum toluclasticum]
METDIFGTFERFKEHLPIGDDMTLMILKGHLLIEEQISILIKNRTPNPSALEKAELTSLQQICLAEALVEEVSTDRTDRWLWPAIKKLNTLRNKIAHNLSETGITDRIVDFVGRVPNSNELGNLCHRFEVALWVTCAEVHLRVTPPDPSEFE